MAEGTVSRPMRCGLSDMQIMWHNVRTVRWRGIDGAEPRNHRFVAGDRYIMRAVVAAGSARSKT